MGRNTQQLSKTLADEARENPEAEIPIFCSLGGLDRVPSENLREALIGGADKSLLEVDNLGDRRLAWHLDGLDEVPVESERKAVLDWCASSSVGVTNRVVIASRPHALPAYSASIITVSLDPFTWKMIEKYLDCFTWDRRNSAERLLKVLQAAPELAQLAKIPLFLTLIVIVARTHGADNLPRRREGLYELIVELLLGEWDFVKGVRRPQVIAGSKLRETILKKAASSLYSLGKRSFEKDEFIQELMHAIPALEMGVDVATVFFQQLLRDSIILPFSDNRYGFFHFSVHEFLAAADLADDLYPDRVFSAIQEFFDRQGWWEEVIVFYASIKRDIGKLISEMNERISLPPIETRGPDANLIRLLDRILRTADHTSPGDLEPSGSVAASLAALNYAGMGRKWKQLE